MSELVVLTTTWIFEISCKNGYVGLLDLHLLLLLIEILAHCRNVVMLSLFYRSYFGICLSKLAELVPLPYCCERSWRYSNRMHDFSVIPRCLLLYITSTYTLFKSKVYNHQVRQVFHTWDLNQQECVQRN